MLVIMLLMEMGTLWLSFFPTHLGWRYIIYQPTTRENQQKIMKTATTGQKAKTNGSKILQTPAAERLQ